MNAIPVSVGFPILHDTGSGTDPGSQSAIPASIRVPALHDLGRRECVNVLDYLAAGSWQQTRPGYSTWAYPPTGSETDAGPGLNAAFTAADAAQLPLYIPPIEMYVRTPVVWRSAHSVQVVSHPMSCISFTMDGGAAHYGADALDPEAITLTYGGTQDVVIGNMPVSFPMMNNWGSPAYSGTAIRLVNFSGYATFHGQILYVDTAINLAVDYSDSGSHGIYSCQIDFGNINHVRSAIRASRLSDADAASSYWLNAYLINGRTIGNELANIVEVGPNIGTVSNWKIRIGDVETGPWNTNLQGGSNTEVATSLLRSTVAAAYWIAYEDTRFEGQSLSPPSDMGFTFDAPELATPYAYPQVTFRACEAGMFNRTLFVPIPNGFVFDDTSMLAGKPVTVAGSTSGTASFAQPLRGTNDQWRVVVSAAALVGTAVYVFPVPFPSAPSVTGDLSGIATVTQSQITLTGTTSTGTLDINLQT